MWPSHGRGWGNTPPDDICGHAGQGPSQRPRVSGKFLFLGEEKLYVRGVTYGTFRPGDEDRGYPDASIVARDFALMAQSGINTVRTYTSPPRWLLDIAHEHGLFVMVGLPWEEHVTFLDSRERAASIVARVRAGVRECSGHPAVLCYAVGNEIPAPIVRWHGRGPVERFIRRLYHAAKEEDPAGLVTYVNFPSTEYLELPFLDLHAVNVYLEEPEALEAYLLRLQNLAGEKPLMLTELGLDSRRNGEEEQARVLRWQLRSAYAAGCAGAFVFAWTDEWHRGGYDIENWDFGLTRRDRTPKPALAAVREELAEIPFPRSLDWPRVSVIVCSYNGDRTLRDCLDGLRKLDYPDFEVIVVNDGSTDETSAIAAEYDFQLINTPNRGLGSARNTGLQAATGEIVAYIDSDARPDPHWLMHLAAAFRESPHAGMGGPNIAPPGGGFTAQCVANAPGGPIHVLLSDSEAEHIPGCNMAFRAAALEAIEGFDTRFSAAGDDVDVCWRIRDRGWTLGFSPAAVVWHHPRSSVRAYWRQQLTYGKAEAQLERKWPERYNSAGHVAWGGRMYAPRLTRALRRRGRVWHGAWGMGLFQSVYEPALGTLASLSLMPEWYLLIVALAGLSAAGALWTPLLLFLPLLVLAVAASAAQAVLSARRASVAGLRARALVALLHLLQPAARLSGRLQLGLTPWRRRSRGGLALPRRRAAAVWSESWRPPEERVRALERTLRARGAKVVSGSPFDRWDLEVRAGAMCSLRILTAVEEHGAGRQLTRFRCWPRWSIKGIVTTALCAGLAMGATLAEAYAAAAPLAAAAVLLVGRALQEGAGATAAALGAIDAQREIAADPALEQPRAREPRHPAATAARS